MSHTTGITLDPHLQEFINRQIDKGSYSSVSETVSAGLRLLEELEAKKEALRNALIEGENSGRAEYSIDALIEELDAE